MLAEDVQKENGEKFKSILLSTHREGIGNVISGLDQLGFFAAPASVKFHGAYPGGLVEHSLNVYRQALCIWKVEQKIRPDIISGAIAEDNLAIASLLHDVCKADVYKVVQKWRKDPMGNWEQYSAYEKSIERNEFGHGEASLVRLLHFGLKMTEAEELAIRWHMGAWDLSTYSDARNCFDAASKRHPLVSIVVAADWLASRISEAETSST